MIDFNGITRKLLKINFKKKTPEKKLYIDIPIYTYLLRY